MHALYSVGKWMLGMLLVSERGGQSASAGDGGGAGGSAARVRGKLAGTSLRLLGSLISSLSLDSLDSNLNYLDLRTGTRKALPIRVEWGMTKGGSRVG
jgi:hypothetical protein